MPLKYSCFISYRREAAKFARDFHLSLENELKLLPSSLPIFRDETDLNQCGDFYNKELSLALCESACMVMIYAPIYFDKLKTYCAREYKSMEMLEAERLKTLGRQLNREHSLIIPLIFRGLNYFPDSIKKSRAYHDFTFSSVSSSSYLKRKDYQDAVRRIAEYINLRCNEISEIKKDPCKECGTFQITDIPKNSAWLSSMLPPKQELLSRRQITR